MTKASKMVYCDEIIRRYTESDKYEKGRILDEYCKVCGYNRKNVIQKLSSKLLLKPKVRCKIGRPKKYYSKSIEVYIFASLENNQLNMLKATQSIEWLEYFEAENETDKLTEEDKKLIRQISASTIDRLLASHRNRYQKRGLSTKRKIHYK